MLGANVVASKENLGRMRRRQGKELIRLDSFMYGFVFALAMTLIRFFWGK